MKQNNGMLLPEDFVDMNDVETGYVDGKGPESMGPESMGPESKGPTYTIEGKPINIHIPGTFRDTYVAVGTVKFSNGPITRYEQHSAQETRLNTTGKVAIAATAIAATAGITCAILGACGVFDKD